MGARPPAPAPIAKQTAEPPSLAMARRTSMQQILHHRLNVLRGAALRRLHAGERERRLTWRPSSPLLFFVFHYQSPRALRRPAQHTELEQAINTVDSRAASLPRTRIGHSSGGRTCAQHIEGSRSSFLPCAPPVRPQASTATAWRPLETQHSSPPVAAAASARSDTPRQRPPLLLSTRFWRSSLALQQGASAPRAPKCRAPPR